MISVSETVDFQKIFMVHWKLDPDQCVLVLFLKNRTNLGNVKFGVNLN